MAEIETVGGYDPYRRLAASALHVACQDAAAIGSPVLAHEARHWLSDGRGRDLAALLDLDIAVEGYLARLPSLPVTAPDLAPAISK